MVRNTERPNVFSQQIADLEPGRLYSFRMYSNDFPQDTPDKQTHAVTIKLDNVTLIPEKCFTFVWTGKEHGMAHVIEEPGCENYQFRVFRAKGTTAKLTVSDWSSETDPGGPGGQTLMYHYLSVQPYFGEEGD